ncbi:MAG TPA: S8 family serine peptidase, partial [Thermoanaerobaculia bacterium]|nr:S8 family serine peptidase [Thermoanaerobaculia bacterium]
AVSDENGHGTAVAGVVGALTNNDFRVAGLNWDVELLNLRVLDAQNRGTVFDGAKALETTAKLGADVASLAWGGKCPSTALWNVIWYAKAKDVLVVAAAGNEHLDLCLRPEFFPASFRHSRYRCVKKECLHNLLVVGATDLTRDAPGSRRDKRASFSNNSPGIVQLGAPGEGITTTGLNTKEGGILDATGTSMATALVAGAAALVACALPENGPDPRFQRILDRLLEGADRVCELKGYFKEGRRLNVVHAAQGTRPDSPDCSN